LWRRVEESELIRYVDGLRNSSEWTVRPSTDSEPDNEYTVRPPSIGLVSEVEDMVERETERDAKEFFDRGKSAENPEYMRRAASYYQELNRTEDATECEAYALKFERKLQKAGQLFKTLEKFDLAKDCFWDGQLWHDLLGLQGNIPAEVIHLAKFMTCSKNDSNSLISFSVFLAERLEKDLLPKSIATQWQSGISEYCARILSTRETSLSKETWTQFSQVLEELDHNGYANTLSAAAECYYSSGDLRNAIRCWESNGDTLHNHYFLAKAHLTPYPKNLKWWSDAGNVEQVHILWQNNGGISAPNDSGTLRLIAPILEQKKRYWDACQVYLRLPDTDVKTIVNNLKRISSFTTGMVANLDEVKQVLFYLSSRGQWDFVTHILTEIQKPIANVDARVELCRELIRKLATSKSTDELSDAATCEKIYRTLIRPVISQKDWQDYLSMEKDMAPAIEKLGFDLSLRFYEKYIDGEKTSTRDFSRQRWIYNTDEKIEYYIGRNEENKILRLRSDYIRRKRDWVDLPSTQSNESNLKDEILRQLSPLRDLPVDTRVKEDNGKWYFKVADFDFIVYKPQRVVTVQDPSVNSVKFVLEALEIKSSDLEIYQENTPQGRIYSIAAWKMGGNIMKEADSVILEIAVVGLEKPFTINL
jgi:hypothetical protein